MDQQHRWAAAVSFIEVGEFQAIVAEGRKSRCIEVHHIVPVSTFFLNYRCCAVNPAADKNCNDARHFALHNRSEGL